MGIRGLLPELKDAIKVCPINKLSGKKAAVDVSGWIYRALGSPDHELEVEQYVYRRVTQLRRHKIDVVLVFDGPEPPAKRSIVENRKKYARCKSNCC